MNKPRKASLAETPAKRATKFSIEHVSENEIPFMRMLVAGFSKSGRTWFARSAPKPLFIEIDTGVRQTVTDPSVPIVPFQDPTDAYQNMHSLLLAIRDKEPPFDGVDFQTVVIDSISEFSFLLEEDIKEKDPPSERGARRNGTLFMSDYNLITGQMLGILHMVSTLPYHTVVLANASKERDEERGGISLFPDVSGSKLGPKIVHKADQALWAEGEGDLYYLKSKPEKSINWLGLKGFKQERPDRIPNSWDELMKWRLG